MKHSLRCTDMVRDFEGCKLTTYRDAAGVFTNGYGNTHGVTEYTPPITMDKAVADLEANLMHCDDWLVHLLCSKRVTQNQFDALVCFMFNVGHGAVQRSTVLRRLLADDIPGAAEAFLMWNKAGGKELAGLTRRRHAEKALFLEGWQS